MPPTCFARFLLGALLAGVLWKNLDTFGLVPDLARKVSEDAAMQAAFAADRAPPGSSPPAFWA